MERSYLLSELADVSSRSIGQVNADDLFEGFDSGDAQQSYATTAKGIGSVTVINTDTAGDDGAIRIFVGLTDPGIDHAPLNGDLWFECDAERVFG